MEIVSTSIPKKKEKAFEELLLRKVALKQQIQDQKQQIAVSSQNIFSISSLTSSIVGAFGKSMNIVDGVLIGYRIMRAIRRVFKKN
jgi:hypothetical protein